MEIGFLWLGSDAQVLYGCCGLSLVEMVMIMCFGVLYMIIWRDSMELSIISIYLEVLEVLYHERTVLFIKKHN
jgi:hypothetical protein